jgi:hypothetical protein
MTPLEADPRSPERRARDEQIAAEPHLAPLDLPPDAAAAPMESYRTRQRHRPLAVAGIVENGLVRPRVDLEQQLVLLDLAARLEVDLDDVPRHAGTNVHGFRRLGAAGEVFVIGDFLLRWLADDDLQRRRGGDGSGLSLTAG